MIQKAKKQPPLKVTPMVGKEGQALIANNADGLRCDNVFPELVVLEKEAFIEKFGPTRSGWEKAIYSNGTLVNLVGKSYGVLPNLDFFGGIENKLLEADINVMTRSINKDDRAFSVEHILNDERYHIKIMNGMDELRPMLAFTTSYDGSAKVQGHFGFFRTVCQNGLHVAQTQIGFSVRHTGNITSVVVPEIEKLIQKFMDNEFYQLKKKFEVLAETPIKNIEDYVELVCEKTQLFKFAKSEENEEPSRNAELVIETLKREAKLLNAEPSLWLGYNSFNSLLFKKLKKGFTSQFEWDAKLFDCNMELATAN